MCEERIKWDQRMGRGIRIVIRIVAVISTSFKF